MIRSDNGNVTFSGNAIDVLAEFSCVVEGMKKSGIPIDMIRRAFDLGCMSEEEWEDVLEERTNEEILDCSAFDLAQIINGMFGDITDFKNGGKRNGKRNN